ncbi:hypothetical protein ACIQF6_31345 [Kitasatospora sp. NPDC092948]|uniref:DUF7507 domain-containing protein n=1 Tax=Kitasatospora sp. NPDC092948 TaxID=3364088 RepID=UPI0037FC6C4D
MTVHPPAAARPAAPVPVTLSKTGTDVATGSTTDTTHGGTVRWVVSKTNPGTTPVDVTVTDVIQGGPGSTPQSQTYVPGSLQAPPGFTKQWSTDGGASFTGTDQGVATNVVQAHNPEFSAPATGLVVQIPPPFTPVNTATGGDGFTPILYTATINGVRTPEIWNIYHHGFADPASVVCTDLLTNGGCPAPDGSPATWPQALNSAAPGATTGDLGSTRTPTYVQIGSKLYYAAISRVAFAEIGVGCIDLQAQASCGFTELQNGTGQVVGGVVQAPNQHLYVVSGTGEILCYDAGANAPCGTFDIGLPPNEGQVAFTGDYAGIMRTIDGKIYITDNQLSPLPTVMSCFDPSTNAACAGWATPKTIVTPTNSDAVARADNIFEMYDPAGTVTGVCTIVGGLYQEVDPVVGTVTCFDLLGNAIAAPPGLSALVSTNVALGEANFQVPLTITAPNGHLETEFPFWIYRGITPTLNSTSYCYDWTTQAPCAQYGTNGVVNGPPNVNGGNTSPYGYAYDGQCKYGLGDTGYLFSIDPVTGASPCQKTRAQGTLDPAAYYCDGLTGHVRSYGAVSLLGIDPTTVDFTQSSVTVLAADGTTVGTFPFDPVTEKADISSVPIADSPIQVIANLTFTGGASFPPGARMEVTFDGDAPQICFETTVAADCSITSVSDQASAVTDGQAPVLSNTATLRVAAGPECAAALTIVKEVCTSTNPLDCGSGGPGPWAATTTLPPGSTAYWRITVTNVGPVAVNGITITDPVTPICAAIAGSFSLAPGDSHQIFCDLPGVTQTTTNTATATFTGPDGTTVTTPPADATVVVQGVGALTLQKTPDSPGPFRLGDTVSYTYTVTNTGTATVHNVTVTDDRVTPVTCDTTTLDPGQSTLCHGTYVITAADVTAGQVTNTAHVTGTTPDGDQVVSPPTKAVVPVVGDVVLTLTKAADSPGPFRLGDTISYTYTVTNSGTARVDNLVVVDDHVVTVTCGATSLNPGESTTCHGTYVVTEADVTAGHVTNTAHVEGTDPVGDTVQSPPVQVTVPVIGEVLLVLEKTPDSPGPFRLGDTVAYTYTITNKGTATVHDLALSDDHVGSVTCDATTLDPGQSTLCHGTYVITAADVTAGHVTNTAHVTGTDPQGEAVESPPVQATVPVIGTAELTLQKTPDSPGPFRLGDTVSYTYTVTNTGTATVHNVIVTDDHVVSVTCDLTTLNPGEITHCHGTYVVTAADVTAGHVTNTAHVEGADPEGQLVTSPPAEATVPVIGEAVLVLEKTPNSAGPFRLGEVVPYTYTVTNTGTAAVHDLTVTDDHIAPVTCDTTVLNPGESTLCHGLYVVMSADVAAGHVTNTAHASGTDPEGQTVVSPPAEATVPVVGEVVLSLTKAADSAGPFHLGETVSYTYTVTNTGTAAATNLVVNDDHVASVTCGTTTLNPGESTVCHGLYVVTAADVAAGHVTNTAHAEGTDPEGQTVPSPPAEATVPVVGEVVLSLTKAADSPGPFRLGDTVSYTYTVTNTGTAAVQNLAVIDDHVAPVTCDATALNPGEGTLCHGTYVVTAADVAAGHVTNTAHAEGTDPQGQGVKSPPAEATVPVIGSAELTVQKTADSAGPFHLGETVSYTYTVTNTGTAAVHSLTVADDHVASVTCGVTTLNPGESTTCHGLYVVTAADVTAGHVTNSAHSEGTDPEGQTVVSPPAEVTVPVVGEALLAIEKTPDSAGPFRLGDSVSYTYTVTNTGTAAVTNLAVVDDHVASVTCGVTTLNPGESTTCHGSYVVTAADVTAGHVTNTAHAEGTDPQGQAVTSPPAEATVPVVGIAELTVQKAADSAGPFHVGETVSYTYTVTNTGTAAVNNLTVSDDHVASVTCAVTTLNPGESTTCHGSYVVTAADVTAGHVTNSAHAEGTDPEGQTVVSPPAEVTVPVVGEALLAIEKTPDSAGPFRLGDTVSYTYTVTNTGTAAVTNLAVVDDHVALVTCAVTTLNPGESTTCHGSYVVTAADVTAGHVTNTAHAEGTDPQGQAVTSPPAEATVPVVGIAELTVQKTADSAGPFHVGDTVSYTYTVTNPGTAAVTNLTVADDHVASVTCAVTTLNPGESTTCHGSYVVTAADVTAGSVTNTAHAEGTDPEGQTVVSPPAEATVPVVGEALLVLQKAADSAGPFHVGDTVPYTYTVTNTGTATVTNLTVTDDHITSVTCDTTTLTPGASTFCHGTYVITAADVTAGSVTNTAHANGTDPQGQSVQSPPGEATIEIAGDAALTIEKVAESAGPFHLGDTVTYTYTVTNAGTAVVTNLVVTDDHVAPVTCDSTTLNPGTNTLCHGTYVITAADVAAGHVTNTAHADGTDPQGQTVTSPTTEATVPVVGEGVLTLQKVADSAGPFHVGDTVSYTYTVTNTGTAAVSNITVSDDHVASVTCAATSLNPGESTTCHGTYVVTAADVTAGHVTNSAHAEGTDPQGQTVTSPPAEVTVPVVGEALLTIEKAADSAGPFHVGDTVNYTYTVTNTGTAAVNALTVTDDHVASVTCAVTTLNPGDSTLCHGSYVVTAADVTAGHVTNTAHANGTDPQGQSVTSPPGEATVPVVGIAELAIQKVADTAGPFHVGDTVSYTYTVTNTGTAAVSSLTVSDDHVASVTCAATSLNPGESTTCHGSYVVTAADVTAGHVTNSAHAEGTDPQGQTVTSPPAEVTVPVVGEALLTIEKAADSAGPFHGGDTVNYTYTVTNTGTAAVTNLVVTDDHVTSVTCDSTTLNPGASTLCHGSYVITAADVTAGHVTNSAHAEGTDPQGQLVTSPPGEATVPVVGIAELAIQKVADSAGPFHVGDTVSYTYTVTNTGTAAVNALTVSDDHVASVTCAATSLNPGESTTCHGSYVVTAADVTAGHVTNSAHAEGTDPQGQTVTSPPGEATVPVVGEALLTIEKVADGTGPFHVGDTVNYTYTVTNTGTAVVSALKVVDDHVVSVTCAATTLNPGASTLCHGSYVVTAADVTAGHVTNTAHASGTDPQGQSVTSPPGEATVPVAGIAELAIQKVADSAGPFHVGDTVSYTYTVTNTGTAVVNALTVADDHVVSVACAATTLNPGESTTCHGSYVVTAADVTAGHVTNSAHAEGTDPQGQTVVSPPAEATVPVAGEALLTIEKVADGTGPFHVGDTVNYTYTVANTGTAAVHGLTVTDDHVASVTCDSTTLNPGASTLCHGSYVITAADVTAGHVTNSAHADGTDPDGKPVTSPPGEATVPVAGVAELAIQKAADSAGPFHVGDTVNYTYTVTNTGTAVVNALKVVDDHVASVTCDSTTLNPGTSTLCHGSYVITAADVTAGHVTNSAHAEGTDPQGQTVTSPPGEATVPVAGEALLTIEKTADSAGPFHVGDTVNYTYTVTNTGTAVVNALKVVDDHVASVTCAATTLNPGASTLCHGSYVITAADVTAGHVTNSAHAEGTGPDGQLVTSPPGEATVPVAGVAELAIQKAADSAGPFHVGDTVSYTYTVTNTGTAVVNALKVVDDHVVSVTCAATTLNPGASTLCHGSYVITAADVTAGHVTNSAHAEGTDPQGQTVTSPPGEATVPVVGEALLTIEKTADSAGPFHVGDTVNYTYTVTNTGTAVVNALKVVDDHVASVTCDSTTLNPGTSTLCHGSYVVTAADVAAGHVTNSAHAEGTDPDGKPVTSPPGEATVSVVGAAELSLQKVADSAGPFHVGDTVNYTYTVTNSGTAAVSNVTVTDDHVASVTCGATTLNPGQSTTCHGSYVITAADAEAGHVMNKAHASGTDPSGNPVESPSEEVDVPVAGQAQLSLVKKADAAGPFRAGDTVNYTYTVTNTGTAVVSQVTVSDDRVAAVSCDATTLNPGASTLCHGTYVVTAADVAAGHVTNTAHAGGTDPEGRPVVSPPGEVTVETVPSASSLSVVKQSDVKGSARAGDTVTYTYTVTNTGSTVLTDVAVRDDRVASVVCDATTLEPGQSTTCRGTYLVTEEDAKAGHVTNRATASGRDPEGQLVESQSVELCVTVSECPEKEACGKLPHPSEPPHGGGKGHLPDTGSPAVVAAAGLAGGGLLTVGGVLLYRARRRREEDRFVG